MLRRKARHCPRGGGAVGDGEPIIINGGTTTYQMVEFLADRTLAS